ncbi:hypothetical protein SAMN05421847_0340 [Halpernia humi]|uniref:Addiction module component n=1 Tax=Halpernia humi TaxID=493375 RepID=A0A1H5T289_9FLAO|nr:hypothetical protein [Halpernia humi]SEF56885.1 hypothetical protein SAMN05421847_0340 [Halpernia humi]
MDIQAEKLELMELLLQTDSKSILEKLRNVFKSEKIEIESLLTDEQWAIVAEERMQYLLGEGENYSWDEAKKIIRSK